MRNTDAVSLYSRISSWKKLNRDIHEFSEDELELLIEFEQEQKHRINVLERLIGRLYKIRKDAHRDKVFNT